MIVKIKNKMFVSLEKAIQKTRQLDGIIECIELDQYEARDLLNEYWDDYGWKLIFNSVEGYPNPLFLIKQGRSAMKELLEKWHKQECEVMYEQVKLVLKAKK